MYVNIMFIKTGSILKTSFLLIILFLICVSQMKMIPSSPQSEYPIIESSFLPHIQKLQNSSKIQSSLVAILYDEQAGEIFTQDFESLNVNVTATDSSNSDGYGPSCLLNGLSNMGYWYQVGLKYNWPYVDGSIQYGFALGYDIFDPSGSHIFPTDGGGSLDFTGSIHPGDIVSLNIYFEVGNTGQVILYAHDYNTGAYASISYSSEGATKFVGSPTTAGNNNGCFTGLMTEVFYSQVYHGNSPYVPYSNHKTALNSAWLWADEFESSSRTKIFSDVTNSPVIFNNNTPSHGFKSNGVTEYADAYSFITGEKPLSINLISSPIIADVGTQVTLQFTSSASGGTGPYIYTLFVDNILKYTSQPSTDSLPTPITIGTLTVGNHGYYLKVTDSEGHTATSQTTYFNVNANPMLIISSNPVADQGQNMIISFQPSYGSQPYQEMLYLNGVELSSNQNFIKLNQLGQNNVYAKLIDAAGYTVTSNQITITVNSDPVVTVSPTSNTTDVGLPISFSESIAKGSPPFTISWYVGGNSVSSSGPTFPFLSQSPGTFLINAQITDIAGFTAKSANVYAVINSDPVISSFNSLGKSTNFFLTNYQAESRIEATGGTAPYTYRWYLNGKEVAQTSESSYIYTFSSMGSNAVNAFVVDAAGYSLSSNRAEIQFSYDFLHIGAILVVIIGFVVSLFLINKRRFPKTLLAKQEQIKSDSNRLTSVAPSHVRYCPHCGMRARATFTRCPYCGKLISSE
jgi:hypothetical protein